MLGNNPVAAVFAREITPGLTSLVKKLDQATADNTKLKAFVVLLTDDDKAEARLKELADKEKLKNVLLMVEAPAGPPKMDIAKDADVTVVLYQKKKVKKTLAFEKGKLTEPEAGGVVTAVKETLGDK